MHVKLIKQKFKENAPVSNMVKVVFFCVCFQPYVVLILACVNAFFCLVLGSSKVYLGTQLESRALVTDSKYWKESGQKKQQKNKKKLVTFPEMVMAIVRFSYKVWLITRKYFWVRCAHKSILLGNGL